MVEGELAGLAAAKSLGLARVDVDTAMSQAREQLIALRAGPVGEKIRTGLALAQMREDEQHA